MSIYNNNKICIKIQEIAYQLKNNSFLSHWYYFASIFYCHLKMACYISSMKHSTLGDNIKQRMVFKRINGSIAQWQ